MSFKSKLFAGAAALSLVGGVGIIGALSAEAATPSCGTHCLNIYNKQFGKQFELDVFRQGAKTGQPVILFQRSNSDPAQDFTVGIQGQVSDLFASGQVGPQVMLHYGCKPGFVFSNGQGGTITCPSGTTADDWAGELEYAPYGVDTGLCAGVPSTASRTPASTQVSLQPCGINGGTIWILDTPDICSNFQPGQVPLINGLDTNFSHPLVLTYPSNGYPTDKPRPQLAIKNLTGFSQNGSPSPNPSGCGSVTGPETQQLWSGYFGIAK
jgi:hypothetical protein